MGTRLRLQRARRTETPLGLTNFKESWFMWSLFLRLLSVLFDLHGSHWFSIYGGTLRSGSASPM